MAKDLVLDVVAKKNSRDLSTLADEFDRLAKQTDDAGKKMHQTGTFSQFLDNELKKTKTTVKELGEEFEKTGDKDVFAKLRGAQSNVKSLERIKGDLAKALEDGGKDGGTRAGGIFGQSFAKQFSATMEGFSANPFSGPALGIGLAVSIAAAAPMVGAAVDAALLLGVGAGGLAMGIVGQIHAPIVQSAIASLGRELGVDFNDATSSFAIPLAGAANMFRDTFHGEVMPALKKDFDILSKEVEPLAAGLGGALTNMLPGFDAAVEKSAPLLHELAMDMPDLGSAISDFFDSMAGGEEGAVQGLRTILMLTESVITGTGNLIENLSNGYTRVTSRGLAFTSNLEAISFGLQTQYPALAGVTDKLDDMRTGFDNIINGPPEQMAKALHGVGAAAALTSDDFAQLTQDLSKTTATMDSVEAAMANKMFTTIMNVDQANLNWHSSLLDLDDALKKNHLAIDKHTALVADNTRAGIENRKAIDAVAQGNMATYQSNVAAGMAASDAAKQYDDNTAALERQLKKAGYTQAQIDSLIGSYKAIPTKIDTDVATHGLTEAIQGLTDTIVLANHLDGRVSHLTIEEEHRTTYTGGNDYHGHASGSSITGAGIIKVGEMGPEYLSVGSGTAPMYVTPNSAINGAANSGGQDLGTITVVVQSEDGNEIIRKIVAVGRSTNRTTFNSLIPVGSAR